MTPLLPPEIARRAKRPYRAPILRAFVGPNAPAYVRELTSPSRLDAAGLFLVPAVTQLLAKAERSLETGLSETDEMALVGVISSMLWHEQFIAAPRLAAPAEPNRVVVGKVVHGIPVLGR